MQLHQRHRRLFTQILAIRRTAVCEWTWLVDWVRERELVLLRALVSMFDPSLKSGRQLYS